MSPYERYPQYPGAYPITPSPARLGTSTSSVLDMFPKHPLSRLPPIVYTPRTPWSPSPNGVRKLRIPRNYDVTPEETLAKYKAREHALLGRPLIECYPEDYNWSDGTEAPTVRGFFVRHMSAFLYFCLMLASIGITAVMGRLRAFGEKVFTFVERKYTDYIWWPCYDLHFYTTYRLTHQRMVVLSFIAFVLWLFVPLFLPEKPVEIHVSPPPEYIIEIAWHRGMKY